MGIKHSLEQGPRCRLGGLFTNTSRRDGLRRVLPPSTELEVGSSSGVRVSILHLHKTTPPFIQEACSVIPVPPWPPQQPSLSGNDVNNSFPSSVPPHPNGKTSRNSSSGYSSFRSSSSTKYLVGNVNRNPSVYEVAS